MVLVHRPLVQILLGSTLECLFAPESVRFYLGSGGTLLSDLSGRIVTWLFFYGAIHGFYRTVPPAMRVYLAHRYPDAPTSAVPQKLVDNMKEVAHHAFPLYIMVPILTDWFMVKGWSMACEDVQECGGPVRSVLGCLAYFLALELLIFVDHYYLLHKWDVGKRLGQHAYHHVYKYADQLNAFSGYSFAPQDGFSQGLALALCTLVVPVPIAFVYSMEVLTGLWTLYIHSDVCPLPWPMMGCDYHYIHHRYNWYNFGFMTVSLLVSLALVTSASWRWAYPYPYPLSVGFMTASLDTPLHSVHVLTFAHCAYQVGFDTLFRTVKHPKDDALSLALGQKPMPDAEKRRSAELTEAILLKRGREALSSDDAAGHARPLPAWLQEQVQAEASGGHEKAS